MYRKLDERLIGKFTEIVGEGNLFTESRKLEDYSHDEFPLKEIRKSPEAVARPGAAAEVSEILEICNRERIPVTPRGGGTGLVGGCVPVYGGLVLSLERMNRVVEVDVENLVVTAEAGVTLSNLYKAIEQHGLFFPPHPGEESATVGGIIATNAGGARAVKYGVVRNFVRGVEAVLPDGQVLNIGGKIIKSSSGYSLLHLLVGSEGTLAVTTRAVLSLLGPPEAMYTLVIPYNDLGDAIRTVPAIIRRKIMPLAVEFVEKEPVQATEKLLDRHWPCREGKADLVIIVDGTGEEETMKLAEAIGEICLQNGAIDVFIADDREKQANVLEIRSKLYEAMKDHMVEFLDISVPRAEIAAFTAEVNRLSQAYDIWLPSYGHAADGNIHTHIMKSRWHDGRWEEIEKWEDKYPVVRKKLHELGRKYNGIVSGEHGIGLVKKEYLSYFLGERQVELMRQLKRVFDPNVILNPGKIFDA